MGNHHSKLRRIFVLLMVYLLIILSNIVFFGYIYRNNNCIVKQSAKRTDTTDLSYRDSLYFSGITYLTIGYGDVIPNNNLGKILVVVQGFTGILINSTFGGLFIYHLLKRSRNILLSKGLHIRYCSETEKYYLSIRIGNRGKELMNINRLLELYEYRDGSRERKVHISKKYNFLEKIIYWEIDLEEEGNQKLLQHIKDSIFENRIVFIRILISGIDTETGELTCSSASYTPKDILFIKDYKKLYKWKDYKRTKINWNDFDSVVRLESKEIERFRHYQ